MEPPLLARGPRVANAPCSWGVLEFDGLEAPSYSFDRVLDEMAVAGYTGTELGDWGFMPTDPARLQDALARRALALVGAFVPVKLADPSAHEEGAERAIRTARLLAGAAASGAVIVLADETAAGTPRAAVAGRVQASDGLPPEAWTILASGAGHIAHAVRDATGLRTVFHPHCGSLVETVEEIGELMQRTDPDVLGLCLDTGHVTYAGGDPEEALRRFGRRIWHVHLKDCSPSAASRARSGGHDYFAAVREGVFCELGQGEVRFPAVLAALATLDYSGWVVVEQDVLPALGSPAASARRNREYLRGLGL